MVHVVILADLCQIDHSHCVHTYACSYRSAKDAFEAYEATKEKMKGAPMPAFEDRFDGNCITPGTEFMAALTENLNYFIRKKIQEDYNWRSITIVFSGHEVCSFFSFFFLSDVVFVRFVYYFLSRRAALWY